MAITKTRRLFGGTRLTFKCPRCGATMPVTPSARRPDGKVACKSCATVQTLSGADLALLEEQTK